MPRKTKFKEAPSYSPSRSKGAGGSRRKARALKQAVHQLPVTDPLEIQHEDKN